MDEGMRALEALRRHENAMDSLAPMRGQSSNPYPSPPVDPYALLGRPAMVQAGDHPRHEADTMGGRQYSQGGAIGGHYVGIRPLESSYVPSSQPSGMPSYVAASNSGGPAFPHNASTSGYSTPASSYGSLSQNTSTCGESWSSAPQPASNGPSLSYIPSQVDTSVSKSSYYPSSGTSYYVQPSAYHGLPSQPGSIGSPQQPQQPQQQQLSYGPPSHPPPALSSNPPPNKPPPVANNNPPSAANVFADDLPPIIHLQTPSPVSRMNQQNPPPSLSVSLPADPLLEKTGPTRKTSSYGLTSPHMPHPPSPSTSPRPLPPGPSIKKPDQTKIGMVSPGNGASGPVLGAAYALASSGDIKERLSPRVQRSGSSSGISSSSSSSSSRGGGIGIGNSDGLVHSFSLTSSMTPLWCSLCGRARTSIKAFTCTVCGYCVHKQCLPLVQSDCTKKNLKSTNTPVAFLASQSKHRGLRAVNLKSLAWEGILLKLGSKGIWNPRYFVLPADSSECDHLFYFPRKPDATTSEIPTGGIPLSDVIVQEVSQGDQLFALALLGPHLERTIVVAAANNEERRAVAFQLRAAIKTLEQERDFFASNGPWQTDWNSCPKITRSILRSTETAFIECSARERVTVFKDMLCIDADRCGNVTLYVKLLRAEGLNVLEQSVYFSVCRAYYAGAVIAEVASEPQMGRCEWDDRWLELSRSLASLPCETVMMFSLYCVQREKVGSVFSRFVKGLDGDTVCIGHVHLSLTDLAGQVRTGSWKLRLWKGEGSPLHYCFDNVSSRDAVVLHVELPEAPLPIAYATFPIQKLVSPTPAVELGSHKQSRDKNDLLGHNEGKEPNPLILVPYETRVRAWFNRAQLFTSSLPQCFSGCDFRDPEQRSDAQRYCEELKPSSIPGATALHLLGSEFPNIFVRALACQAVCSLSNEDLLAISLVMICSLRYDPWDWSVLTDIYLNRILKEPRLCHSFYWAAAAQANLDLPQGKRFTTFIQRLFSLAPGSASLLIRDAELEARLAQVASDERRKTTPAALLMRDLISISPPARLPSSTEHIVQGIKVDDCKVMTSNAAPLWLQFDSAVDSLPPFIYKSGDDLRQDEFCLLVGSLMSKIWTSEGLESRLVTYRVVSTGVCRGIIEAVPNCTTVAKMQGGFSGAFKGSVISEWLQAKKPSRLSWEEVVRNFTLSLASSCIFEFILGLGDRHGDNIMLQPDGTLFHIDFGYILGNKTTFVGIKREIQPFTLSHAMVDVLGGKDSSAFCWFRKVIEALYLSIRHHHVLLTGVAMNCLSSKMTHLGMVEDVYYMRDSLAPELDENQAKKLLDRKIQEALDVKRTKMNDAVHNLVAASKKK